MAESVVKVEASLRAYSNGNFTKTSYVSSSNIRLRRFGPVCVVGGWVVLASGVSSNTKLFSGFPPPNDEVSLLAYDQNNNSVAALYMKTDGCIYAGYDESNHIGHYINLNATYITAGY